MADYAKHRAVDSDPHSFSLLDPNPDPGGKILREKKKNARKLVVPVILF